MENFTFSLKTPLFLFQGWRFTVQIFTFENVYELQPEACTIKEHDGRFELQCRQLTWAGGQESIPGFVHIQATSRADTVRFSIKAQIEQTIRSIKLLVSGLPDGTITNLRETEGLSIPSEGVLLKYPDGWRSLYTPLVTYKGKDGLLRYFRSLDDQVRAKRFAFIRREEEIDLELIFEQQGTALSSTIEVPAWEIGYTDTPQTILQEHTQHIQQSYGLQTWEERQDVPAWAREISLVATIHCQHWTGYVFNDYAQVLETLRWLARHIEPRRILAYLPGWEGRYYWQYGDYRPDTRMGGEEGFAHLTREARQMGIRLMPMFGINYANQGLANFEQWGTPSRMQTVGGHDPSACEDWDAAREHDHGWQCMLNPGAPGWQNRLVTQIHTLIDRYGFDGIFLDIAAGWLNDARYDVYAGTVELIRRIRQGHPEVLVSGEGWYDAMSVATPLAQSGHTRGVLNWHDRPYAPLFETYTRSFAHLCLGDPGRQSAGTHEVGYLARNPITRTPVRKSIIPTVSIVEDTLRTAPEKVLEIVEDAKTYAVKYL